MKDSLTIIKHKTDMADVALLDWKKSKMEKLINMIKKAKANNQPYDTTMVPSKADIAQEEPNTTDSLSQTPPNK